MTSNETPDTTTTGGEQVSTSSLDEQREWLTITCPNGHTLTVQAHEGGSRAHCDTCLAWVDYGGYTHTPVEDALKAARVAEARAIVAEADAPPEPDHAIVAGDAATAVTAAGQTSA